MKYISLFSGIGGFEYAIQEVDKEAICLGYSEIKPPAIEVYKTHFPEHKNLGDITKITEDTITALGKCDLVVGGFPCTNLSSLAHIKGDNRGLKGKSSKLFYDMVRIIKYLAKKNSEIDFIIENNASMTIENRTMITKELETIGRPVFITKINSADFGVQTRKRLYWTTFPITHPVNRIQVWNDVLIPIEIASPISEKYIDCLNRTILSYKKYPFRVFYNGIDFEEIKHDEKSRTRWQCSFHSDTTDKKIKYYNYPLGNSRPITASFGNHNVLVDRRITPFIIRRFEISEIEKLFGFPENYTNILKSRQKKYDCLGNSVVVHVIKYILLHQI